MIPAPDFDLALTLHSGQAFHWEADGPGFRGALGDVAVRLEQRGDLLAVEPESASALVAHYLALDHRMAEIHAAFPPGDAVLAEAARACHGLRLLRQPFWECLATFITSSMKQVAHIRAISLELRRRYGADLGGGLHAYPSPARLAALSEEDLRSCALGYRARNLLGTARLLAAGRFDPAGLAGLTREAAEKALRTLPGVGPKVANCVLLFACGHLDAFPIDVWIERSLREFYFPRRRKLTAEFLRRFAARHFGPQGGYAQQYLFHYARIVRRRDPRRISEPSPGPSA